MTTQPGRNAARRSPTTPADPAPGVHVPAEGDRATAASSAPTEAEIRQALEENLERIFGGHPFSLDDPSVWEALRPIMDSDEALAEDCWDPEFTPPDDHPGTLWADMRPSEIDELKDPIAAIVAEAEAAFIRTVLDGAVAHAARFAAAHPDIPRGAWRPAAG